MLFCSHRITPLSNMWGWKWGTMLVLDFVTYVCGNPCNFASNSKTGDQGFLPAKRGVEIYDKIRDLSQKLHTKKTLHEFAEDFDKITWVQRFSSGRPYQFFAIFCGQILLELTPIRHTYIIAILSVRWGWVVTWLSWVISCCDGQCGKHHLIECSGSLYINKLHYTVYILYFMKIYN